jgi:polar amino acid transport system substrate-binding protein
MNHVLTKIAAFLPARVAVPPPASQRTFSAAAVFGSLAVMAASTAHAQQAGAGPDSDLAFRPGFTVAADPALAAKVPADVRRAGFLIIGTNPNTPPTVYFADDNKTVEGREIDIMSAVAQKLGLKPRWRHVGNFDNIIPGLASGRYQAALANIDANATRMKHADFVSYYISNRFATIAKGDPKAGAAATDLELLCGQTIGAGAGTGNLTLLEKQNEKCLAQGKPGITIPVFPNRPAGVQSVASGRTPSFMGPYDGIKHTAQASNGSLRVAGVYTVPNRYTSIALAKGSALTVPVRDAVNALIADGTYGRILARWDLSYAALPESKANEAILAGLAAGEKE